MRTALGVAGAPGLTRTLAAGYHGPPELTVTRALTEWTLDPWMLVLIVLLGGGYLAGVRRVRTPRGDNAATAWPVARPIWFCGLGLGFLLIATMSWVGVYQSVLMYPRAVQTVLLVLVVPLFLALGRPLTLFAAVFPRAGARLEAVIRCRPVRILTFPAITTFALVAVPFVMYFTSWYTAVFHSTTVRELTYLVLMVPGYVFFWTLLRVDPVPKEYSYAVSMWITGAEVIGDAFFGIAVIADQNLIGAGYFHALARPWGPTLATDQVIAGGVLWILGDLVGLPFLAAQLIHMMREDESDAARIDAELDAQQAQLEPARLPAAPRDPSASAVSDDQADQGDLSDGHEPQEPQLWWETDPRFTSRFKPTS
ncbi:MAG TPA: cytochrome c oxidase assembly protein [Streptosporangiaceae bacterium]|nr:cytochrome c oxidase assembly protein [Streptosporangiaceae bacterium]